MCKLGEVWKDNLPDWRFGQLMFNFIQSEGDPFYWEEDKFLDKFSEYVKSISKQQL